MNILFAKPLSILRWLVILAIAPFGLRRLFWPSPALKIPFPTQLHKLTVATNPLTMMMNRTLPIRGLSLLLACVVSLSVFPAAPPLASQSLPPYVMRAIDTSLSAILMTRDDMKLRWDRVPDDRHRLSLVKRMFEQPLICFALADTLGNVAEKGLEEPTLLFKQFAAMLDLKSDLFSNPRLSVTDRELRSFAKVDLDSVDFAPAFILRRFLTLTLAADVQMYNARTTLLEERLQGLVSYCDSLVLQSEGGGEATPVELRMAERYGLARAKRFFNTDAADIDYAQFISPGANLFISGLEFARNIAPEVEKLKDSVKTRIWNTRLGRVAIGGPGDDVYTGNFYCIIDVGGNDVYKPSPRTKEKAADRGVSLVVDFSGNDSYIGGDFDFGGTLFGASVLMDMNGDDSYSAGNFALGAGYFGTGVLYDAEGSDRYVGGTAVEGAGLFGIGLLIDHAGNDVYQAQLCSRGFGYTRGVGGIVDRAGNDSYIANSPYTDFLRYDDHYETFCQGAALGSRPVASAGYGFITDLAGSDNYTADIFGQGTAYWFGYGAIVDRKGNDRYNAFQYSQGAGVHFAHGVVLDNAGDDNYVSHGVSQGCGHDVGFGGLYDVKGDDNYVVESLSQGGGNANAISLFIDGAGEDGYIARRDNTMGYSDLRNWFGMIGIFLDLDGRDFFGSAKGKNDTLWTGSFYGAGLDGNFKPKESEPGAPVEEKKPEKTKEEIEKELADDLPTLFIQASTAPQKYQYMVGPARQKIIDRADSSIPFLMEMLNTELPREALALRDYILPKIGRRLTPQLIDTLRFGAPSRQGLAMYVLGEMKDSTAAIALGRKLVDSTNWRIRATAAEALLKMKADTARPYLIRALGDTVEIVRGRAARALVNIADSTELQTLILPLTNDPSQIVRYQIQIGLGMRAIDSIAPFLADALLRQRHGYTHDLLSPLAAKITLPVQRKRLVDGLLADPNPTYRVEGARLAIGWKDLELLERVTKMKKKEKNSAVLFEIYRAMDLQKTLKEEVKKEAKEKKGKESRVESTTDATSTTAPSTNEGEKTTKKKSKSKKKKK